MEQESLTRLSLAKVIWRAPEFRDRALLRFVSIGFDPAELGTSEAEFQAVINRLRASANVLLLCRACGERLPVTAYYVRKDGTLHRTCKACRRTKEAARQRGEIPPRPTRENKQVECAHCGRVFEVDHDRYKDNKTKRFFCSAAHYKAAIRKHPIRLPCTNCGTEFDVPHSVVRLRPAGPYFCSRPCVQEDRVKRTTLACPQCGRTFRVHLYRLKEGGTICCSRHCARQYRSAREAS